MRNNNLNLGGIYGNTISSVSGSVAPTSYNRDYNISTNGGLPVLIGSGSVYVSSATSDPDGMCYCPYNGFMYITQHDGSGAASTILVVNPRTFTVVADFSVGQSIWGIGYCPLNNRLYATDHGTTNLHVIDPATNTSVATIAQGAIYGRFPTYCPTTQRMYFTTATVLSCINPLTNTVEYTVTDGAFNSVGYTGGCYCPINGKIYYDNATSIIVFDPITKAVSNITEGITDIIYKIRFCSKNGMLYMSDNVGHRLIEFSPLTNSITRTLVLPYTYTNYALEYNPNNGFLYYCAYNNQTVDMTLKIIDVETFSEVKSIHVGSLYADGAYIPSSYCYCPSTKRVFLGTTQGGGSRIHQLT